MTSAFSLRGLNALVLFAFPAIAIIWDDPASALFFILGLIGLAFLLLPRSTPIPRAMKLLFLAVGLFFSVALLATLAGDFSEEGFKRVSRYARFLLLIPVYVALAHAPPAPRFLWYGAVCGAILAGLVAMDERWWHLILAPAGRAQGSVNPIIFGDLSLVLATLCLASMGYFARRGPAFLILPIIGAMLGLTASFLSLSRGGWIALPALGVLFLWYSRRYMRAWQYIALASLAIGVSVSAYLLPATGVKAQIKTAIIEVQAYRHQHSVATSPGMRLEMWKAALLMFREHPVLGTGLGGFAQQLQVLIEQGRIDKSVAQFHHPHSEYLAALSTRGILGLLSLLILLAFPAVLFYRFTTRSNPDQRELGLAGLALVIAYAHFGITGDTFDRTLPITFFTLMLAALPALANALRVEQPSADMMTIDPPPPSSPPPTPPDLNRRRSEERFRRVVELAPNAMVMVNGAGQMVLVNTQAEKMFGYPRAEMIAQPVEMLVPIRFRAHDPVARKNFFQTPNARAMGAGHDFFGLRADGSEFPVEIGLNPIDTEEGAMVLGAIVDITERKRVEEELKAALKEKETLLKEVHHRVKNNLQAITSLLYLQAQNTSKKSAEAVLQDAAHRVKSMALIHEKLYQSSDLVRIDFGDYLRGLAGHLLNSFGNPNVHIEFNARDVFLEVETAIPCGLIVNELVSNAMKYAYPATGKGTIQINLSKNENGAITLIVADDGQGFPADIDFCATQTLGMQLVCTLTEQLGGTLALKREQGTTFIVSLPCPNMDSSACRLAQ